MRSALEFAFVIADKGLIDLDQLPPKIVKPAALLAEPGHAPHQITEPENVAQTAIFSSSPGNLEEKMMLIEALRQSNGNQTQAARMLGINRVTVWNRMKKYGIDLKKVFNHLISEDSNLDKAPRFFAEPIEITKTIILEKQVDLNPLFRPKSIAVLGVSLSNDRHPANVIYDKINLRFCRGCRIHGESTEEVPIMLTDAKIVSPAVLHKTELDGVALGLETDEALRAVPIPFKPLCFESLG